MEPRTGEALCRLFSRDSSIDLGAIAGKAKLVISARGIDVSKDKDKEVDATRLDRRAPFRQSAILHRSLTAIDFIQECMNVQLVSIQANSKFRNLTRIRCIIL